MIRRLPLLMVVGALPLLAACDNTAAGCTDMGTAPSGILFEFGTVVERHSGQQLAAHACVEDVCRREMIDAQQPLLGFPVGRKIVTDDTTRHVTLKITDKTGRAVFDGEATVTPTRSQPNGAGCAPIAWNAEVRAAGTAQLRIAPR